MNKQGNIKSIFVWVFSSVSVVLFITYKTWFLSSLKQFKIWYPHYGTILWLIKLILLFLVCFSILFLIWNIVKTMYQKMETFFIFTICAILCFFLDGNYPFSMVKMYSVLNETTNVFYIDDCLGKIQPLQEFNNLNGAKLSHYYYNLTNDTRIEKTDIGVLLYKQLQIDSLEHCICINKMKIDTAFDLNNKKELLDEFCK